MAASSAHLPADGAHVSPVTVQHVDGAIVLVVDLAQIEVSPDRLAAALTPADAQRLAGELSHALIAAGALERKRRADAPAKPAPCPGRRAYTSRAAARAATQGERWRHRAYRCDGCGAWHTTNDEKNARRRGRGRGGK